MLSPTLASRQRQIPTHTPLRKTIGESDDRAQWMRNTLQLGRGDGTWAQVADFAGVAATDWTWGSAFLDVDLDGFEDLLAVNGHRWDIRDADTFDRIRNSFPRVPWNEEQGEFPRLADAQPRAAEQRRRDLPRRCRAAGASGADSAIASQGIALADFDLDGDLDPVVTRLERAGGAVPQRVRGAPRIAVRALGHAPNGGGIGASVTVRGGDRCRPVARGHAGATTCRGATRCSPSPPGRHPADHRGALADRTTIGHQRRPGEPPVRDPPSGGDRAAAHGRGPRSTARQRAVQRCDGTPRRSPHVETLFDDFARQPLLPKRFSQLGPGLAWVDVERRWARGSRGRQRQGRCGSRVLTQPPAGFVRADGAAVVGDLGGLVAVVRDRMVSIVSTQSNYEAATAADAVAIPSVVAWPVRAARPGDARTLVGGDSAMTGPVAAGDVNGDGIPDLFVGARVVAGAWPAPARSHLFRGNRDGGFEPDPSRDASLAALGMVTAATFADLTGDGRSDLVVTSEWGPVRVLHNVDGQLRDATESLGLSGISSRWIGVTAGDFDGDGRLDLVATSWGRNTPWRASPARPHELFVARFGSALGLLFAQRDSATGEEYPLESLSRLGVAWPDVRARIGSYDEYARATAQTVLGDAASAAIRVGATTFDHTLFLNRGARFEPRALPPLAQLAPASAPVVADFDGDGREDLFLSQNFFPTEIGTMRFDAGAGLVLRGDGAGGFTPLSVRASGIEILGDQRGAAVADYDGDARADLVVTQNGAATRLFRNVRARQGVRVRVDAGPDNRLGIGTQLRVMVGERAGPVREVRAGTGYWSTDGATTVLALPDGATSVEVRWPGGQVQAVPLSAGMRELRVARQAP